MCFKRYWIKIWFQAVRNISLCKYNLNIINAFFHKKHRHNKITLFVFVKINSYHCFKFPLHVFFLESPSLHRDPMKMWWKLLLKLHTIVLEHYQNLNKKYFITLAQFSGLYFILYGIYSYVKVLALILM